MVIVSLLRVEQAYNLVVSPITYARLSEYLSLIFLGKAAFRATLWCIVSVILALFIGHLHEVLRCNDLRRVGHAAPAAEAKRLLGAQVFILLTSGPAKVKQVSQ